MQIYEEQQIKDLYQRIIDSGKITGNRTKERARKVFCADMKFDLRNGSIPLVTSKYASYNSIVCEFLWMLKGYTDNKYLNKLGTGIWNHWAAENGSVGPLYGAMWRRRPVSLGAMDQVIEISKLAERYPRSEKIVEVEQVAIESVAQLNENWIDYRQKYPREFAVWCDMLSVCGTRFLRAMAEGGMSVTTKMEASRAQRVEWFNNIVKNTVWSQIYQCNDFHTAQPSDIYEPWLCFNNFMLDIGRIGFNENRKSARSITSFFHGVRFYSPETTVFLTPTLRGIYREFIQSNPRLIETHRPLVFTDQIMDLIETLRADPNSRRIVVNSWEPSLIPDPNVEPCKNPDNGLQALTPCHHDWQVTTAPITTEDLIKAANCVINFDNPDNLQALQSALRNVQAEPQVLKNEINVFYKKVGRPLLREHYLNLRFSMRSSDAFLGLPYNLAFYATALRYFAELCNMTPYELVYQGTDVHLYENAIDAAEQYINNSMFPAPQLRLVNIPEHISDLKHVNFVLSGYSHAGTVSASVAV